MMPIHQANVSAAVAELMRDPDAVRLVLVVQQDAKGAINAHGFGSPLMTERDLTAARLSLARAESFLGTRTNENN